MTVSVLNVKKLAVHTADIWLEKVKTPAAGHAT